MTQLHPHIRLEKPSQAIFDCLVIWENEQLDIHLLVDQSETKYSRLAVFVDGQEEIAYDEIESDVHFSVTSNDLGRHKLSIQIQSGRKKENIDIPFLVTAGARLESSPLWIDNGINYSPNSDRVGLALFAPNKRSVHLIGDFNDWQVLPEYQLLADSRVAERFWIELGDLPNQKEFAFQYLLDGHLRTADPYSEKILDERDSDLPTNSYPGLKQYPLGKTEEIVGVFRKREAKFDWTDLEFKSPKTTSLHIYELFIRDYSPDRRFERLRERLDYLQDLGINAVELMPVFEFEDNRTWGYNTTFYFATDKLYGPSDDLKRFIDEAHSRGIAVILDVVFNHNFGESPLVRLYNHAPYGAPTEENPWFNSYPTHDFNVGYDFDHDSEHTRYLVRRVLQYWMKEFHVDGFRFDLSKGFTQKVTIGDMGKWAEYDFTRIENIKRMADAMWEVNPGSYVILEHFANNDEEIELAHYRTHEGKPGILVWNSMHRKFSESLMGFNVGDDSNFISGYHHDRGWSKANLVSFMESHDHERLMVTLREHGACRNYPNGQGDCNSNPGAYNTRDFETALDRIKMAACFLLSLPGPKMLWQLQELGYDIRKDEEAWSDSKPSLDDYFEIEARRKLFQTFKTFFRLRREEYLFTDSNTQIHMDTWGNIKMMKLHGDYMNAVVIGNFGVDVHQFEIDMPQAGMWYDFFTGNSSFYESPNVTFSLMAGEYHILTSRPIFNPAPGLLSLENENGPRALREFKPTKISTEVNSYNSNLRITYSMSKSEWMKLQLFNKAGERLYDLVDGEAEKAASGFLSWKIPQELPAGVYILRFTIGDQRITKKVYLP